MLDLQIRTWISDYLSSRITLRDFQERFIPATWEIEQADDDATRPLAYEIQHKLNEFTSGHLPESELRDEFRALLEGVSVDAPDRNFADLLVKK